MKIAGIKSDMAQARIVEDDGVYFLEVCDEASGKKWSSMEISESLAKAISEDMQIEQEESGIWPKDLCSQFDFR